MRISLRPALGLLTAAGFAAAAGCAAPQAGAGPEASPAEVHVLREMVYGLDATFSEEALRTRINSDLANDLGNLFARSLGMSFKCRQGIVPTPGDAEAGDKEVTALAQETAADFLRLFPGHGVPQGAGPGLGAGGASEPLYRGYRTRELAKDASAQIRRDTVLYHLLEGLRWLAVLLSPVMPTSNQKMATQWPRLLLGQAAP